MEENLGIIFLHHKADKVVLNNLSSIRQQNPNATVATISAGEKLPGGYALDATPDIKLLHAANPSRSSDWLVCSWFLQRKEKCQKWWIVEWDTFARVSVRSYYAPVWDFPFVASSVNYRHRNPEWCWFTEVSKIPEAFRPYAMGATPFLYLVSEQALAAVCDLLMQTPISAGNGELRFSTAANKCGFPPCAFSPPNDQITWQEWDGIDGKGKIIHPVKQIFNPGPVA